VNSFVAPGLLGNASDSDGDTALSVTTINGQAVTPDQPMTLPSGATVIIGSDNSFTYTPPANWIGTDSFQYTVTDGTFQSSPATITVNVTDQQPVANAEGPFTVLPGATLPIDVLANAYSADSANLTPVIVQGPTRGTATIVDGIIDYTPNPGVSSGTDQITYEVSDGILNSSPQTVSITVSSSQPLVANPVYLGVTENTQAIFTDQELLASVQNALSGSTVRIVGFSNPSQGTLTRDNNGFWDFTPNGNSLGTVTCSFIVSNGSQNVPGVLTFLVDPPAEEVEPYEGLSLSSDGSRLASVRDREVHVWDAQTGRSALNTPISLIFQLTGQVTTFWPLNHNVLAVGSAYAGELPEDVSFYQITNPARVVTGRPLVLPAGSGAIKSLSFSPDGTQLAVVAGNSFFIYQVTPNRTRTGLTVNPEPLARRPASGVLSAVFVSATNLQVTQSSQVAMWEAHPGQGPGNPPYVLRQLPNQTVIASRVQNMPRNATIVATAGTVANSGTLAIAVSYREGSGPTATTRWDVYLVQGPATQVPAPIGPFTWPNSRRVNLPLGTRGPHPNPVTNLALAGTTLAVGFGPPAGNPQGQSPVSFYDISNWRNRDPQLYSTSQLPEGSQHTRGVTGLALYANAFGTTAYSAGADDLVKKWTLNTANRRVQPPSNLPNS
jgi:hypothetical protein